MRIKLTTKLMKNTFSKIISKLMIKQTGCEMDIQIDKLDIVIKDGKTVIKTNVEIELENDEFRDLIKMYI